MNAPVAKYNEDGSVTKYTVKFYCDEIADIVFVIDVHDA